MIWKMRDSQSAQLRLPGKHPHPLSLGLSAMAVPVFSLGLMVRPQGFDQAPIYTALNIEGLSFQRVSKYQI